jgi:hypothetical protein
MKPLYTSDGFFAYRSRCMEYERAQAFALCLRANSTRFTGVDLSHSERAKGSRSWFVTFAPVNPDRMADIGDRENAARIQRADREGAAYLYMLDVDSPRPFYRVYNPKSGETYELDSSSCSCADFVYRCDKASGFGLKCKHIHEMTRRFDAGELVRLTDAYDTPEWRQAHPRIYGVREYSPAMVAAMAGGA